MSIILQTLSDINLSLKSEGQHNDISNDEIVVAWFYIWFSTTILFNICAIIFWVIKTLQERGNDIVDLYMVWEYRLIVMVWASRFLSTLTWISPGQSYTQAMILNITMYMLFFTFEYFNLSKFLNMYLVSTQFLRIAKARRESESVSDSQIIKTRGRHEKVNRILLFIFIISILSVTLFWMVLSIAQNCTYSTMDNKDYLDIDSNWEWHNWINKAAGYILPVFGGLSIFLRIILFALLRSKMKEILHQNYNQRKILMWFTFLGMTFLFAVIILIALRQEYVKIREIYLFGNDFIFTVEWIVASSLVIPFPSSFMMFPLMLFNLYSVDFKRYIINLFIGIQKKNLISEYSYFIVKNNKPFSLPQLPWYERLIKLHIHWILFRFRKINGSLNDEVEPSEEQEGNKINIFISPQYPTIMILIH